MRTTVWPAPSKQLPSVLSTKEALLSGISDPRGLARGLGWFSLGLGLAQVLAPRAIEKSLGLPDGHDTHRAVLRGVGLREIASGLGILAQRRPTPWLWARVAGDAMDLALLGLALTRLGARRERVVLAGAAVAAVMAIDLLSSRKMARTSAPPPRNAWR